MLKLIWTITKSKTQGHEPMALHETYLVNLKVMNVHSEHRIHFVNVFTITHEASRYNLEPNGETSQHPF
jgi:hypothetical protein